jgi:hypothetical protein
VPSGVLLIIIADDPTLFARSADSSDAHFGSIEMSKTDKTGGLGPAVEANERVFGGYWFSIFQIS